MQTCCNRQLLCVVLSPKEHCQSHSSCMSFSICVDTSLSAAGLLYLPPQRRRCGQSCGEHFYARLGHEHLVLKLQDKSCEDTYAWAVCLNEEPIFNLDREQLVLMSRYILEVLHTIGKPTRLLGYSDKRNSDKGYSDKGLCALTKGTLIKRYSDKWYSDDGYSDNGNSDSGYSDKGNSD